MISCGFQYISILFSNGDVMLIATESYEWSKLIVDPNTRILNIQNGAFHIM